LLADDVDFTSKPAADTSAQVKSDISTGETVAVAHAVGQIHFWIDRGQVPFNLWREWIPALMNLHRYQEVAQLALDGSIARPGIEAIEPLMEFRAKALLAINKPREALQAAKSYYNVSQLKNAGNALNLVELCLAKAYPEDAGIARRFRSEQILASGAAAASVELAAATTQPAIVSLPTAILKTVTVDASPFENAIKSWANRARPSDRDAYVNLLLAADRGADAEAVGRALFKSATSTSELTLAIETIVRSLRAEDGSVARANTWLFTLQQAGVPSAP
jgi:hypothetical protein